MGVRTANAYGRITITEDAIAHVAANSALECYGIVDLTPRTFWENLVFAFNKKLKNARGVKISTSGDRIFIDLFVIIKYGVSIDAVAQSLKKSVKYDVEKFTGMVVDTINVNVAAVRV